MIFNGAFWESVSCILNIFIISVASFFSYLRTWIKQKHQTLHKILREFFYHPSILGLYQPKIYYFMRGIREMTLPLISTFTILQTPQ